MGKKLSVLITLFFLTLATGHTQVSAQSRIAGASATMDKNTIATTVQVKSYRSKAEYARTYAAIRRVLKNSNSPMVESTPAFVKNCIDHNLDCYLLPAISGLESGYGRAILPGSNNPFGWGGGYMTFKSWDEAISTVATGLEQNYIGQGAVTIEQIGSRYAASPTWAPRVRAFMETFKRAETLGLNSEEFGLEL